MLQGDKYKPMIKEEIKLKAIESMEAVDHAINKFKEAAENLTFTLAVMNDGVKRYLKTEEKE